MLPTKQMNEQINRMLQSDVITSSKCQILFRNHFCKDPGDEMDKRLLDFCKDSSDEGKRDCFDSSMYQWRKMSQDIWLKQSLLCRRREEAKSKSD